ncbi:hypothetical protein PFNF135_02065 [Plasmodium falciparum NF135/5.C10]|uniref:Uncharacterized protein n=1 Tax=Plasmodium falciparum NF135/5.C10 TaxID=1036726 RepID=W4III8_PLAFA|nr:hypothetical protein PFNF135_02065 [Plasmodium falciparum NF135/5.C10]
MSSLLCKYKVNNLKETIINNICTNCFIYIYDDEMVGLNKKEYDMWFNNIRCIFCNETQTINKYFIGIIKLKHRNGKNVKYTCHKECLYFNNYTFNHIYGNRYFNLTILFNHLYHKKCSVCLFNFPSLKCSIYNCYNFIHLNCAYNYLSWPNYSKTSRHEILYCYEHQYMHGTYHNYNDIKNMNTQHNIKTNKQIHKHNSKNKRKQQNIITLSDSISNSNKSNNNERDYYNNNERDYYNNNERDYHNNNERDYHNNNKSNYHKLS